MGVSLQEDWAMEAMLGLWVQEYQHALTFLFALILILGAWRNWNWLCDPLGKPDYLWLSRALLRVIFLCLGVILLLCELYWLFL